MSNERTELKWKRDSWREFNAEYEGFIILVSVNDKGWNNWFIIKDDEVLDCAQYHSPTHNELATKVQAERCLTGLIGTLQVDNKTKI